jgi:putative oxidoreductase
VSEAKEKEINMRIYPQSEAQQSMFTSHTSTAAVAFFLAMVGLDKFTGGYWIHVFDAVGYGQWFRYFTACIQVAGAVLLVIRKTSLVGALLLACTMIGAMIAQVRVLEGWGAAVIPAALLAALLFVAAVEFVDLRERRALAKQAAHMTR